MQLNDAYPRSWVFTQEELAHVREKLCDKAVLAFLESMEADALIAAHTIALDSEDMKNTSYRVLANEAYTQGQLHLLRRLREFAAGKVTQATNSNKED